jgi:hypothetical protein
LSLRSAVSTAMRILISVQNIQARSAKIFV